MIRFVSDFRLVPIVLIATICLFALKTMGLVFEGGYVFGDLASRSGDDGDITGTVPGARRPDAAPKPAAAQPAKQSWAQEMFGYPDITGSVGATPPVETPKPAPAKPPAGPAGTLVPVDIDRPQSPAERALLERLQERRTELDARAKELDMQESLLRAAEKRLEGRIAELKDLEARVNSAVQQKEEGEQARLKNLITMYENMKAKDAAKIFDRLDIKILVDVVTRLNPRRMSDIMALMSAETAQRLTVELANRDPKDKSSTAELPKIEGRPTAN